MYSNVEFKKFVNLNITKHLIIALFLRVIIIVYGNIHDQFFVVPYTDVDYKVFTDGARHVLNGNSPFKRHTYRYSPLLAWLVVPNILIHSSFGKILFSLFDVLAGLIIYNIVRYNFVSELEQHQPNVLKKMDTCIDFKANISALLWLYNPSVFIISTRGNCDAISSVFVLLSIYLLQCKNSPFLAGLIHGFVIHFRLYPLMYSLAFFMYLGTYTNKLEVTKADIHLKQTIFKKEYLNYLIPNFNQIKLILGTLLTLIFFIGIFYIIYGYQFLFETYIYHFIRKDTRHNFSLYFYMQYLSSDINISNWRKVFIVLPQYLLILVLSIRYGLNKSSLNFSLFTITFVMITYNTVLTSQYFVWLMVILPLCMWQIKMNKSLVILLVVIWVISQLAWLLPAYFLEMQGKNTFIFIWIQSVAFFSANIGILGRIIRYFKTSQF